MKSFWIDLFHLAACGDISFMSFPSLRAHFFLVLNDISLSGCITVYPFYLLKDILSAQNFWQYEKAIIDIQMWVFVRGNDSLMF